jgi:DnaK suppressor protein
MDPSEAKKLLVSDRHRLEDSRATLLVDEHSGHPQQDAEATPQDSAEVSEQLVSRTDSTSELAAVENELADVLGALARLEAGTYGLCVDCGEPISDERLLAVTSAARCVDDQRQFEHPQHELTEK